VFSGALGVPFIALRLLALGGYPALSGRRRPGRKLQVFCQIPV
jgi:hypothetical protein